MELGKASRVQPVSQIPLRVCRGCLTSLCTDILNGLCVAERVNGALLFASKIIPEQVWTGHRKVIFKRTAW